jgi:hypothetical protein
MIRPPIRRDHPIGDVIQTLALDPARGPLAPRVRVEQQSDWLPVSRSRAPAARPLLTTDAASPGGNNVAQTREPSANTPRPGGESKTSWVHFTSA